MLSVRQFYAFLFNLIKFLMNIFHKPFELIFIKAEMVKRLSLLTLQGFGHLFEVRYAIIACFNHIKSGPHRICLLEFMIQMPLN